MKLSELANQDRAFITAINSPLDLKHRLNSFGIFKNTEVKVENISLSKNTMTIEVEHTSIALRMDEAQTIEVEKQ